MAIERTLVFIKPDGVKRKLVGDIIARFEKKGLALLGLELRALNSDLADKHYHEHLEKSFYPGLKSFIMSGPVVVMVLEGESAVSVVRRMVGVTDSALADAGTIRGDYSLYKGENIIHASDSVENSAREIKNFFSQI